ncbi:MAG TPA: response regulator [Chloroflexota bacterium]|jgi:DNA-binding response OmpR family regulator|nr:response regulator [Chloroflexota bacterium]
MSQQATLPPAPTEPRGFIAPPTTVGTEPVTTTPPLREEAQPEPAPQAGDARTVLVVEDEKGLADVLAVHLQASGYQPIVVHDGLDALYTLDRITPQAVVLDLNLPQVSGFRLINLLKQRPEMPRVPVVVLTALSFQEAEDAVRAGADDFITKPFLPAEVVTRVDRVIERLSRLS